MERRQGSGLVGWGLFLFWTGIWVAPQPRFAFLVELGNTGLIPILGFSIPIFHLIIYILFVITGGWITIEGVKEITLWASETHRTDRVVTEGIYSIVRHPQYLGGLLAHFGIFVVPSAWHSNLFTQIISFIIVLISRKEEQELAKEFEDYTYTIKRLCQY